jgi:hypothetical protein
MPSKVILMVASGIIVVAVVGVVLLVVSQGGKPGVYYGMHDNPNSYPGATLPTSPPASPPSSPPVSDEDLNIPMECESRVQTEQCLQVTLYRLRPPKAYYWEMSCGIAKFISETVDGVNIYSYNSLLGEWYHTINSNPQDVDANYAAAQELIGQFKEHDLIPAGVSLTCKPLGSDISDSDFQPPAGTQITDMGQG